MLKMLLVAIVAFAASTATASADDRAAGAKSFKKCAPCHDIGENAKNKVGPLLNGLAGRKAGTIPEYAYSDANKSSGLTWDKATFLDYIKDPKAKIPKTKMVFIGIKKESEAEALWHYIKEFGPDGKHQKSHD
ncbi:MAG: c-type cytochrome [Bradyrhizobiaceae bacterium]|nr:c-type cytochrome [Bradyrhizobiaceae bacterium]